MGKKISFIGVKVTTCFSNEPHTFNQRFVLFWNCGFCDELISTTSQIHLCSQSLNSVSKTGVRKSLKLDVIVQHIWFKQLNIANTDAALHTINHIALVWHGLKELL